MMVLYLLVYTLGELLILKAVRNHSALGYFYSLIFLFTNHGAFSGICILYTT